LACLGLKLQLLDVCSHVIPFDSATFDYRYREIIASASLTSARTNLRRSGS
jgi:hypothetical protein